MAGRLRFTAAIGTTIVLYGIIRWNCNRSSLWMAHAWMLHTSSHKISPWRNVYLRRKIELDFDEADDKDDDKSNLSPQKKMDLSDSVASKFVSQMLVKATQPSLFLQKTVDKYWEEFYELEPTIMLTNNTNISWMHVLKILWSQSDPADQLTFLEAWKESQGYSRNTTTKGVNNVGATNITRVKSWRESWKEEMTTDDVRDIGDHIWRYLIGGEFCFLANF
jgi:hypothetical protein